ncbi:hypothetical protein [Halocatena salina]|uniref:Uncharacterized protein n=1 Tax=Halocatena salina TaxID=2934340 RepID=A0A8U0A004_9EURY|nr:hypothetical protein [Halocatena salina]UPM41708.1 hypothetical protein MW046_06830 [Halocatena salina]
MSRPRADLLQVDGVTFVLVVLVVKYHGGSKEVGPGDIHTDLSKRAAIGAGVSRDGRQFSDR